MTQPIEVGKWVKITERLSRCVCGSKNVCLLNGGFNFLCLDCGLKVTIEQCTDEQILQLRKTAITTKPNP